MMKNKIVSVAAIALLTTGMVFANTSAVLPGATSSVTSWDSTTPGVLPGVQVTPETVIAETGKSEARPGIGMLSDARGSASPNTESLPGVTSTETLQSMNR